MSCDRKELPEIRLRNPVRQNQRARVGSWLRYGGRSSKIRLSNLHPSLHLLDNCFVFCQVIATASNLAQLIPQVGLMRERWAHELKKMPFDRALRSPCLQALDYLEIFKGEVSVRRVVIIEPSGMEESRIVKLAFSAHHSVGAGRRKTLYDVRAIQDIAV